MRLGQIRKEILFSLVLMVFSSLSYAGSVSVFGPETFTRTTGKPDHSERSFRLSAGTGSPFIMKVTNGTPDGAKRVSSASIYLNGAEVIRESDFNQKTSVIEKEVSLIADNKLAVDLRSSPGSSVSIEITGVSTAPSVKKVVGADGGVLELQGDLNSVKLVIPPGALDKNTEITIRQVPTPPSESFRHKGIPIGNTFSFEPHGLKLSRVATITFGYKDSDLPPNANEGEISVYVDYPDGHFELDGGAQCDPVEKPTPDCYDTTERYAQDIDNRNNLASVFVNKFSCRLLYYFIGGMRGCNGVFNQNPTMITLESADGFRLPILRCLRAGANARPPGSVISNIVLHSTSNTNIGRTFQNEISTCAIQQVACGGFAGYYISRDGTIVQVAEDRNVAHHTQINELLEVSNSNSIGIELFNNVGEPYNGAQMTALTQLIDMLIRLNPGIERPTFPRDPDSTSVFSHNETDPGRRHDPVGTFRMSDRICFFDRDVSDFWSYMPLEGGSPAAGTLFDAVIAGVSAMGRDFKGLINTSGGDSLGLARAGTGGNITIREQELSDLLPIAADYTDNNPLIVPPGQTADISGTNNYTDVIIQGTLRLTGDTVINIAGTLFIAPEFADPEGDDIQAGRIISAPGNAGRNGYSLTLNSNGSPVINGMIDMSGRNAEIMNSDGGNGGIVSINTMSQGPLFIPTLVSRGGDADQANVAVNLIAGQGGNGGNILISSPEDIILSGGIPPVDTLPPPPPYNLSSIGIARPVAGQRVPLMKEECQVGFNRGFLTSGGMGGSATGTDKTGGQGGNGGNVEIVSENQDIIFRDIDIITGADAETVLSEIFLPIPSGTKKTYFAVTGSLGGKGALYGGDGGTGGNAGAINVRGILRPAPVVFPLIGGHSGTGDIIGFDYGHCPWETDDPIYDFVIGQTIQARSEDGSNLYRLRVNTSGQAIGGSGGIPGGSPTSFPGFFGHQGTGGNITGLRIQ